MSPDQSNATDASPLLLDSATRAELWRRTGAAIEAYRARVGSIRVAPEVDPGTMRALLTPFDFSQPMEPLRAITFAVEALKRYQVHTPHPRYFGLFNPAPTTVGVIADALVAAFNPQLAAWGHNPFAVEVEHHLVRAFGTRFGYDPEQTDGTFCSGGSEANHTALLAALAHAFPEYGTRGARSLASQPVFYISAEGHHSFHKAAQLCGLGRDAVREIPVGRDLRMDAAATASQIQRDRRAGLAPFLIVATAGTTNAGAIDPLDSLADLAVLENLWLHADAAWGGAAAFVPQLRSHLASIERADSITFDAHKWLSVPMGAGLYLTRHTDILRRTFQVGAPYVPPRAAGLRVEDPYTHSIQWSRRFIGLKVFLSLAVAGWEGYALVIRQMTATGQELRQKLEEARWGVVNPTPLPIACFVDRSHPDGSSAEYLEGIAHEVAASGTAWISTTRVGGNQPVLRACITNYRTQSEDLRILVESLEKARERLRQQHAETASPGA